MTDNKPRIFKTANIKTAKFKRCLYTKISGISIKFLLALSYFGSVWNVEWLTKLANVFSFYNPDSDPDNFMLSYSQHNPCPLKEKIKKTKENFNTTRGYALHIWGAAKSHKKAQFEISLLRICLEKKDQRCGCTFVVW